MINRNLDESAQYSEAGHIKTHADSTVDDKAHHTLEDTKSHDPHKSLEVKTSSNLGGLVVVNE